MSTEQLTGRIFDIQRMSLHDGPGIRTTVFFKGCNLRCFWCHNPESYKKGKELQYFAERCIGCGLCVSKCQYRCHSIDQKTGVHTFLRDNCENCGQCASVCPSGSLVLSGSDWSVPDLVSEVMRDKPFFDNSGGGITASGGEPLLQHEFLKAFWDQLREKHVHTAIESALNVPFSAIEDVLPYTDLFLVDFKHPDANEHENITGSSNELILHNIKLLDQTGIEYCIRIPIIPGVNDTVDTMAAFDKVIGNLKNPTHVELMPYHKYGLGKYNSMGLDTSKQDGLDAPAEEQLFQLANAFTSIQVEFRSGPQKNVVNRRSKA